MFWKALREEEFEEAIEKSGGLCVIPLGCLEKHGQHLPVGTDVYIAESVVEEAAKLEDVVILHAGPWLGEVSCFHQDADPAAVHRRGGIGIKQARANNQRALRRSYSGNGQRDHPFCVSLRSGVIKAGRQAVQRYLCRLPACRRWESDRPAW